MIRKIYHTRLKRTTRALHVAEIKIFLPLQRGGYRWGGVLGKNENLKNQGMGLHNLPYIPSFVRRGRIRARHSYQLCKDLKDNGERRWMVF
jgi:hypothetical protein